MPSNEEKKSRDEQNSSTMSSCTSSIDSSYNIEPSDPQYQDSIQPSLNFSRLAYTMEQFNETFEVIHSKSHNSKKMMAAMRPDCSPDDMKRTIKSLMPITDWLYNYNWRTDFVADFVTGLTIAIFQVPQSKTKQFHPDQFLDFLFQCSGMGYSLLAGVSPIYGLYSSFFPALIYSLFGSSRHAAIG